MLKQRENNVKIVMQIVKARKVENLRPINR